MMDKLSNKKLAAETGSSKVNQMLDNRQYYNGPEGHEIMNIKNYNHQTIKLLQCEHAFVSKTLSRNRYATLIELGCDQVRAFEIADMNEVNYIGIDIRNRLHGEMAFGNTLGKKARKAKFISGDLLEIASLVEAQVLDNAALSFFPFNLLGNFDAPEKIIQCYANLELDMIISNWQTSEGATSAREDYYVNCGFNELTLYDNDKAISFTQADFTSNAYKLAYLLTASQKAGYKVRDLFETNIMYAVHLARA
jgi:hypothetical protein